MVHADAKTGTASWVERRSWELQGRTLPCGCNIRCLPGTEREVETREKIDPSLRGGIVAGYRLHTGGKWTDPYQVIDFEAYSQINK